MRIEPKDLSPIDAADLMESIIMEAELTNEQADRLEQVCKDNQIRVFFWRDEEGSDNVGPKYD